MEQEGPTSSDLEQFRQEWQQEVTARSQRDQSRHTRAERARTRSDASGRSRPERPVNIPPVKHPLSESKDEDAAIPDATSSSTLPDRLKDIKVEEGDADADEFSKPLQPEPKTALEHYEKAVEQEGKGQLGDSLVHYRQAFRMDENVDKAYREKHFAQRWKIIKPARSDGPMVGTTTIRSQPEPVEETVPQTTSQLIISFADSEIENAPPLIEGDKPPPCPIRKLPTEVLLELLKHVAAKDVSIYARLASVCKKFAYHVYTERSVWKRIALGREFGLASQLYHFNTDIQGRPVMWKALDDDDDNDEKPMPQVTADLFKSDEDWREFFHSHPRIRYTGVYISTVNYTRSGGASVTPATWGQQVHIVTYYRYLRFFRDGTVLSLLTTHEPREVVHLLTKENVTQVRSGGRLDTSSTLNFATSGHSLVHDRTNSNAAIVPAQSVLKHALRGRWRLCHPSLQSTQIGSNEGVVGDVHIETEGGAGPRYMYTMHLSLKNGSSRQPYATKNNKLVWKGFWSFNSVSGDWAEFQLRHDKAFWFSRVKSYGMGY